MNSPNQSAGYTLLELLVAFSLMVMVGAILFDGLRFGNRIWERSEQNLQEQDTVWHLQNLLTRWIEQAYPFIGPGPSGEPTFLFEGRKDRLSFVTTESGPQGRTELVLVAIAYDQAEDTVTATLEDLDNTWRETRTLASGLSGISFRYFGPAEPDGVRRWAAEWHNRLPELVRVHFGGGESGQLTPPDLVIAPRLEPSRLCYANSRGITCEGDVS